MQSLDSMQGHVQSCQLQLAIDEQALEQVKKIVNVRKIIFLRDNKKVS